MKKLVKVTAALLASAALVGCSGGSASTASTGTASSDDKTIIVGCNPTPMVDILNAAAEVLKEEGYTLQIVEFTDYVLPNTTLEAGELDANYFQTLGYMNTQNSDADMHLVAVGGVHIEPMGFYSETLTDLSQLKDGDVIGVPNDTDNLDRALRVLIQAGLLIDPGKEVLSENDFNGNAETNPHDYEISANEAANLPNVLPDMAGAVINGNYALGADLPSTHPAIFVETFDEETTVKRTNFIVVTEGNENSEKVQALVKAIQSDEVKKFIEETYKGSVITSFLSADDIK